MRFIVAAIGLTLAGAPAFAQSSNQPMSATPPKASAATEEFVQTVAMSDMFELAVSKAGAAKGTQSEKSFSAQMLRDHTKTTSELKGIVASEKLGIAMPSKLDSSHQGDLKNLGSMKGSGFASSFNATQVKAHEAAIALFEKYATTGDNAKLKQWATRTLPTLKHHREMAQGLSS
jgi:putative membrane protein